MISGKNMTLNRPNQSNEANKTEMKKEDVGSTSQDQAVLCDANHQSIRKIDTLRRVTQVQSNAI